MSDNAQDSRPQNGSSATEAAGRSPGRGGATRRVGATGGEGLRDNTAMGGDTARHLRKTSRTPTASAAAAEEPRSGAESAAQELQDLAVRLATAGQASTHELALFAMRGLNGDRLQDLGQNIGTVVESIMRTNVRMMCELSRLTSPAVAIDLQHRFAAEYLDTMLHGTATLFRAANRSADRALRPLEERVARRRQHHAAHGNGNDEGPGRVADVMRTAPPVVSPDDTVQRAVQLMREADLGGIPVRDGDRLTGMVTGRDIALRVVAEARDPTQARVRDVMTPDVPFVFDDDEVDHVAEDMADQRLRRLPVLNREKRLVGVVSLVDVTRKDRRLPAGARLNSDAAQAAE